MEQVLSDNVMRCRIAGSGGVVSVAPFTYLGEEGTQLPENAIAGTSSQCCRTRANSRMLNTKQRARKPMDLPLALAVFPKVLQNKMF